MGKFTLPKLSFELNALEPYMSKETLDYHYGKHHKTYVDNLNALIKNTKYDSMGLPEIVKNSTGGLFNNSAQDWNHSFFWNCLTPKTKSGSPDDKLTEAINKNFGSLEKFKNEFNNVAITTFGSGWAWLVKKSDGSLVITSTQNANTPITESGSKPLLTCDVWEHAYYIDYRNARPKFLDAFWNIVNWEFISSRL